MPRGRYRKKKPSNGRYRKRKTTKKSGLTAKEQRQVEKIAKNVHIKMSDPRRHVYAMGGFHASVLEYAFGSPKYLDAGALGGEPMRNQTVSIPLRQIAFGNSVNERNADQIYINGEVFRFVVSWNPASLLRDEIVKFRVVSTTNDPSGANLGFIPNAQQNADFHIPSLLLPPGDTLGLRYTMDPANRVRSDLDVREYKTHWTRQFTITQNDAISFKKKSLNVKILRPKAPELQTYAGQASTSLLGRRYFLLYNSTAERTTATLSNMQCPAVHARIWTYFRERTDD